MAIRRVTRAGVGLAVGIIILAALVFGGIWLVRERGEQARREQAIVTADEQLKSESEQGVALNPQNSANGNTEGSNTNNGSSNSNPSNGQTNTQTNGSTSPNNTNQSAATPATELPQTGPAELFSTVLIIGLLTFSVSTYLISRKQTAR